MDGWIFLKKNRKSFFVVFLFTKILFFVKFTKNIWFLLTFFLLRNIEIFHCFFSYLDLVFFVRVCDEVYICGDDIYIYI